MPYPRVLVKTIDGNTIKYMFQILTMASVSVIYYMLYNGYKLVGHLYMYVCNVFH